MRILHTSDWHLGRALFGRKRYDEHRAFLDWLADTIEEQKVDALLVAGDIFDNTSPSNRAQELYYHFLCRVAGSCCRHVVVTGGNHDSPTFLNAPRELLKVLNVYVVGAMGDKPEDEVLILKDVQGAPEAIVCAVPYLRDRDVRKVEAGESMADKTGKLLAGICEHYRQVGAAAEHYRSANGAIPLIVMGHLFTDGGKTVDGDGVRELYVGSLAQVGAEAFPSETDYLALGHLHVMQQVGGHPAMRYSGSPLPMGFGEAGQEKFVLRVDFDGRTPTVKELSVPCFQPLVRLSGSLDEILTGIAACRETDENAWLEIDYAGEDIVSGLRERLDEAMEGSFMEIRRIRNQRVVNRALSAMNVEETLDDLDVFDVFERCLKAHEVPEEQQAELEQTYREVVAALQEEDALAE